MHLGSQGRSLRAGDVMGGEKHGFLDEESEHMSISSLERNCAYTHNYLEDSMSLIEKTAKRIHPVIKELLKRMIEEK